MSTPSYRVNDNDILCDRPAPRLLGVDLAVLVLLIFMDLLLFFIGAVSMLMNKEAEPRTVDDDAKVSQTFHDVGCTYGHQRSFICGGLACNALGQHNSILLSCCRQLIANACVSNSPWRHGKTNWAVTCVEPSVVDLNGQYRKRWPNPLRSAPDDANAPRACCTPSHRAATQEKRRFVRRYLFTAWGATWCRTIRKNVFACVKDTSDGVRRPRISANTAVASKTRTATGPSAPSTLPYAALESPSNTGVRPRESNEIDTINTPEMVGSTL